MALLAGWRNDCGKISGKRNSPAHSNICRSTFGPGPAPSPNGLLHEALSDMRGL
jgi:hypothetical protein